MIEGPDTVLTSPAHQLQIRIHSSRLNSNPFIPPILLATRVVQIAAFIGEPLMGAGGVIPPPATYWDKVPSLRLFSNIVFAL